MFCTDNEVDNLLHGLLKESLDEHLFVREPPVHGRHAHPGIGGDVVESRFEAPFGEDRCCRCEYASTVPSGIGTQYARLFFPGLRLSSGAIVFSSAHFSHPPVLLSTTPDRSGGIDSRLV